MSPNNLARRFVPVALAALIVSISASCSDDSGSANPTTADAATDMQTTDTILGETTGADVAADSSPDTAPPDTATDANTGNDTAPTDAAPTDSSSTDSATDSAAADAATDTGTPAGWALPACTTPTGAPGVAFGPGFGKTLQISATPLSPGKTYTMGLAALQPPGVMLAEHAGTFYRSTDSGCTWTSVGAAPSSPMRIVPGKGDRAYAFYDNGAELARIDGATVNTLKSPVANILGIGTDRSQHDVVRVGDTLGQLWHSADGGNLWLKIGKPAVTSGSGYRVAFSPLNPDRVLFGTMTSGLWLTVDAAKTWTQVTFTGAMAPANINGMNAVFSPLDDSVAWAMAIDLTEGLKQPSKTNGKYIWRSTDGGTSFTKIVAHLSNNDVTITNGVHLIPDATDLKVVRWTFGTCFSGYGTNIYRAVAKPTVELTWVNHPVAGLVELIHHPADPTLLVLGMRGDNNPQCP